MISEKTLKRWRGDALILEYNIDDILSENPVTVIHAKKLVEMNERIILLTGELLDDYIVLKRRKVDKPANVALQPSKV